MRKPSKILTAFFALVTLLFSVTAAVAVPILWRGWYYGQIHALNLTGQTGWSEATIRGAFDEVMDFLVKGAPFGTGELKWSEAGMSHFADCRVLFRLDFIALAVTGVLLLALLIYAMKTFRFYEKFAFSPPLLALFVTLALLLIFGLWGLVDFEGLFTAFHGLFFAGKDNWIFDWRMDEIILILPEEFWAKTALLVAGFALGLEALLSLLWVLLSRWRTPKSVYEELKRLR